ncbi:MAG: peptidyl-tRNA hydrolase [Candidatus Hodarchaeales archaeon]
MLKQIIALRNDLDLPKSEILKIIAWTSYESAKETKEKSPNKFLNWLNFGQKKIVIKINSEKELINLKTNIERKKNTTLVPIIIQKQNMDKKMVSIFVAMGIGPEEEKNLKEFTNLYKLY